MTLDRQELRNRFWIWRPHDRKTTLLGAFGAALALLYFVIAILINRDFFTKIPFQDFFAIWSFSKAALTHGGYGLYDSGLLHEVQTSLGMPAWQKLPFSYPPSFIILIYPLGFLPYYAAYTVWIALTFALYFLAVVLDQPRKRILIYGIALAPATAVCIGVGQSAFLLAALFLAATRLVHDRPVIAGILFGLMAFKPQFGVLVPLALIAAGEWRCIAAAAATVAGTIALTAIAFGSSIWFTWWTYLPHLTRELYSAKSQLAQLIFRMPTVLANLRTAGVPLHFAWEAQTLAALIGAAAVWIAWRRFRHDLAIVILLSATWLTTPYAFIYDMPALAAAVFLFAADRLERTGSLTLLEIVVMALTLSIPVISTFTPFHPPIGAAIISGFVALAFVTGWKDRREPVSPPSHSCAAPPPAPCAPGR